MRAPLASRAPLVSIALGLLTCAIEVAAERAPQSSQAKELRWFQVELVVFRQPLASSLQEDLLHSDRLPLPFDMIALFPPEGVPIRPGLMAHLESGWRTPAFAPRLRVSKSDLSPELEDLIEYVELLNLRAPNYETFAMLREVTSGSVETLLPSDRPATPSVPSREPIDRPAPPQALMTQEELEAALATAPEIPLDAAYTELRPHEFMLNKETSALARRAGYRVLVHQAWLQPMTENALATPVMIASDNDRTPGGEIFGTLRVRLSRFLHAELAISLPYSGAGGGYVHLLETRRMRSQELHYVDHPLFGALIHIEPYPRPAPEVE